MAGPKGTDSSLVDQLPQSLIGSSMTTFNTDRGEVLTKDPYINLMHHTTNPSHYTMEPGPERQQPSSILLDTLLESLKKVTILQNFQNEADLGKYLVAKLMEPLVPPSSALPTSAPGYSPRDGDFIKSQVGDCPGMEVDPSGWIDKVDTAFLVRRTPQEYKAALARLCMDDETCERLRRHLGDTSTWSWSGMRTALQEAYQDRNPGARAFQELDQLLTRQTENARNVDLFAGQLIKLMHRAGMQPNQTTQLHYFQKGLPDMMALRLSEIHPTNLDDAIRHARHLETLSRGTRTKEASSYVPFNRTMATTAQDPASEPMDLTAMQARPKVCHHCQKKGHDYVHCFELKKLMNHGTRPKRTRNFPNPSRHSHNERSFKSMEAVVMAGSDVDTLDSISIQSDDENGLDTCTPGTAQSLAALSLWKDTKAPLVPSLPTPHFPASINGIAVLAMIDSGASCAFIAARIVKKAGISTVKCPPNSVHLGDMEHTVTELIADFPLEFGGTSTVELAYVLPLVTHDLILGRPWMHKNRVHFNDDDTLVANGTTLRPAAYTLTILNSGSSQHIIAAEAQELCLLFPDAFKDAVLFPPSREIEHTIDTGTAHPIKRNPYKCSPLHRGLIDKFIAEHLANGTIRKSKSPWSSPILLVPKKNKEYRPCVDYRALNAVTLKDAYPLPDIDESLAFLKGAKIFTSLDLKSGYFQIRVSEADIPKTAFCCHSGTYEFRVMPFGLTNAPATFQRLMNDIFRDLIGQFVLIYLDDILIYSKRHEEHLEHCSAVLKRLVDNQLTLNVGKCQFFQSEMRFLGYIVSELGLRTDPEKVSAITNWNRPKNSTEVRSFLNFCGFYRRFIRNFAHIALPLTNLTKGNIAKNAPITWTSECEASFTELKSVFSSTVILRHPNWHEPFIIDTDASQSAIGAVLLQEQILPTSKRPVLRPCAFYSRKLTDTQTRYSAQERELLAIWSALQHWRYIIEGSPILVRTDHQSLAQIATQKNVGRRVIRFLDDLAHFDLTIKYKPGNTNTIADILSRKDLDSQRLLTNEHALMAISANDLVLQVTEFLMDRPTDIPKQDPIARAARQFMLIDDQLHRRIGHQLVPVLNTAETLEILTQRHVSLGHVAKDTLLHSTRDLIWRPDLQSLATQVVNACQACQICEPSTKPTPHIVNPIPPMDLFEIIGLDFVGPLERTHRGNSYVVTAIDYATGFPFAKAIRSADTQTLIKFLQELVSLIGFPAQFISDNGTPFLSNQYLSFCDRLSIRYTHTIPYHPQGNGKVERFHREMKSTMRKYLTQSNSLQWDEVLPEVLLAVRCRTTKNHPAPYWLVYGSQPKVDFLSRGLTQAKTRPASDEEVQIAMTYRKKKVEDLEKIRAANKELQWKQKEQLRERSERNASNVDFTIGTIVKRKRVRKNKLEPSWEGNFTIHDHTSNNRYQLKDETGTILPSFYSGHNLKPVSAF